MMIIIHAGDLKADVIRLYIIVKAWAVSGMLCVLCSLLMRLLRDTRFRGIFTASFLMRNMLHIRRERTFRAPATALTNLRG